MSELLMVRHGQASFGEKDYDRLSPTGIRQAKLLARHMVRTGHLFDAVYCGMMQRQINTAKELIDHFSEQGPNLPELSISDDFDEYDSPAVWTAQIPMMIEENPALSTDIERVYSDKKTFQSIFEQVMYRWVSGNYDKHGVPAWSDFKKRVENGIRKIIETHGQGRKIIIFTSGGPISAALQQALGLTDGKTIEISWQIMNSSVTRFKYNSRGMMLSVFNDITHLEMEKDKKLITYR